MNWLKVKTNEYRSQSKTVCDLWSHYEKVLIDGDITFHVQCVQCGGLVKWKYREGTSELKHYLYYHSTIDAWT